MKVSRCIAVCFLVRGLFAGDALAQHITGTITTVAGNGSFHFGGDGGPAVSAGLQAGGVAVDAAGNVFIADTANHRIRKVTPAGLITTVAGAGTAGFSGDGGSALSAEFNLPVSVAVDAGNNLYIADFLNHRIRKVTASGVISTIAGNGADGFGGDGGPATAAQFHAPQGIALDAAGNIFVADHGNNASGTYNRVRRITPDGMINTLAGTGPFGFSGDGGLAVDALLSIPNGVAVDTSGNLFIADENNFRIRKVTSDGLISTVAGNGVPGFGGDGGPATSAELKYPSGVVVDGAGNLFIVDSENDRIRKVTPAGIISTVAGNGTRGTGGSTGFATSFQLNQPYDITADAFGNLVFSDSGNNLVRKLTFTQEQNFAFPDRGGVSLQSSGPSAYPIAGYARIRQDISSTTPAGLAIFGFRQNNVLVTEAGVPASPLIRSGRIYAEVNGPVNTGLAIANPNNQTATVSFYFSDATGNLGAGNISIPANGQIARFLNESPFNSPSSLSGSFTFTASVPVSVIALRGLTNERGEFLITTLPVADLNATSAATAVVFPHFGDGGGWRTNIVLVNPTDSALSGMAAFVTTSGTTLNSAAYSIPARASQRLQTPGTATTISTGSVRITPAANTSAPSGVAIFSFSNNGITVAQAGVPAVAVSTAFRLYAETGSSIQTGIAVVNTSNNSANVSLELSRLDGSSTGLTASLPIPSNGQKAVFLSEIPEFASLRTPFQGVLRVSSSSSISVIGLRSRYNERNDFLITTTTSVNEATPSNGPLFFPHIVDSGGYTTQFILFSARPGAPSSGTLQFFSQGGGAWNGTFP